MAVYNVLTWDAAAGQYTEQDGMINPTIGVDLPGMKQALRELRDRFCYTAHRVRLSNGDYDSDPDVLVERTDDEVVDRNAF